MKEIKEVTDVNLASEKTIPKRVGVLIVLALTACAAPQIASSARGVFVDIGDIPAKSASLNHRLIETTGFLEMNPSAMNILAKSSDSPKQVCVGLLVTEREFEAMKKFDGAWVRLSGMFETGRCRGLEWCTNSCGPNVLTSPSVVAKVTGAGS